MGVDQTLTSFRDLLRPTPTDSTPGEAQTRAAKLLPDRIAASRMNWWTPGQPVASAGHRLLIGVAVWSGYDMRLLDFIDAALAHPPVANLTVDVFDADAVRPPTLFEPYIPGIGEVFQTPIVGLWVDGVLTKKDSGYAGRKIVADLFGFDMHELSNLHAATSHR